ncbi:MAG: hypothetical protein LQ346_008634 [Caloplaca aetnensis]|nr:MAG: hypothetical protein LQ346_008634 [Caloplaca aetnensis]
MPLGSFPYHMTADKPFGLIFTNYNYLDTFDNDIIEETFVEATHKINREIASNPALANETLNGQWDYDHPRPEEPEDYYWLTLNPDVPAMMTYGDIPTVLAVLSAWATQYRTVETDFEIWVRPGTGEQRRLGSGFLILVI